MIFCEGNYWDRPKLNFLKKRRILHHIYPSSTFSNPLKSCNLTVNLLIVKTLWEVSVFCVFSGKRGSVTDKCLEDTWVLFKLTMGLKHTTVRPICMLSVPRNVSLFFTEGSTLTCTCNVCVHLSLCVSVTFYMTFVHCL